MFCTSTLQSLTAAEFLLLLVHAIPHLPVVWVVGHQGVLFHRLICKRYMASSVRALAPSARRPTFIHWATVSIARHRSCPVMNRCC